MDSASPLGSDRPALEPATGDGLGPRHGGAVRTMGLHKGESLAALADRGFNVAQFVSFAPTAQGGLQVRLSRTDGLAPDFPFPDAATALRELLARSPSGSVNLRSYTPDSPRSRTFIYGLTDAAAALAAAQDLAREGLHVIANETVDIHDGGVSGVVLDDMIEFAPDDTPRCVEKPGVASLPIGWGRSILMTVYGFEPALDAGGGRLEFSVHPGRRGWQRGHTLAWEYETDAAGAGEPALRWPNRFSRMIGDSLEDNSTRRAERRGAGAHAGWRGCPSFPIIVDDCWTNQSLTRSNELRRRVHQFTGRSSRWHAPRDARQDFARSRGRESSDRRDPGRSLDRIRSRSLTTGRATTEPRHLGSQATTPLQPAQGPGDR